MAGLWERSAEWGLKNDSFLKNESETPVRIRLLSLCLALCLGVSPQSLFFGEVRERKGMNGGGEECGSF